jgi:hypothetical protein
MTSTTKRDTIVIISTKYWDYDSLQRPLFKDMTMSIIPFWEIKECPQFLKEYKSICLLRALNSENYRFQKAIFIERPNLKRIWDLRKSRNVDKNIITNLDQFPDAFWKKHIAIHEFFPDFLKFKKVPNHEIYVLPSLPEKIKKEQKGKYIDFLKNAWDKIYNVHNERNIDRYIFLFHEKDLGLPDHFTEKVINKNDFTESDLSAYCSNEIIDNIGSKYEIVIFQHDSLNSPNINNSFLNKSDSSNPNLIYELEKIILFLKIPWNSIYLKRNELVIRLYAGEDISEQLAELNSNEYISQIKDILKEKNPGFEDLLKLHSLTLTAESVKDIFDKIFISEPIPPMKFTNNINSKEATSQ